MYDVLIERSVRPGKGRHRQGFPLRQDLRPWTGDGCFVRICQTGATAGPAAEGPVR